MSGQAKVKTLAHNIFKSRTRPVPATLWKSLMVRSDGTAVNDLLQDWGAPDIGKDPVVSLLVSSRETTGRITSTRLVVRGPLFVATEDEPFQANVIWPELDNTITLRFSITGETLNFSNRDARNVSVWAGLDTLPSFRAFKDDVMMSPEEVKATPGLKDGACFRVVTQTHSITHLSASLLVVPRPYAVVKAKAREWNVMTESNQIPAIDITDHWARYIPAHLSQSPDCPIIPAAVH